MRPPRPPPPPSFWAPSEASGEGGAGRWQHAAGSAGSRGSSGPLTRRASDVELLERRGGEAWAESSTSSGADGAAGAHWAQPTAEVGIHYSEEADYVDPRMAQVVRFSSAPSSPATGGTASDGGGTGGEAGLSGAGPGSEGGTRGAAPVQWTAPSVFEPAPPPTPPPPPPSPPPAEPPRELIEAEVRRLREADLQGYRDKEAECESLREHLERLTARMQQCDEQQQRQLRDLHQEQRELRKRAQTAAEDWAQRLRDATRKHRQEMAEMRALQEQLARRQMERRERMRRAEMSADGGLGEDPDFDFSQGDWFTRWVLWLRLWMRVLALRYAPLRSDLFYVESRYGEGVAAYFSFHRWMLLNTAFLGFVVLCAFYITHWIIIDLRSPAQPAATQTRTALPPGAADEYAATPEDLAAVASAAAPTAVRTPAAFPFGWMLYSSLGTDERSLYAATMSAVVFWYAAAFVARTLHETKSMRLRELEESHSRNIRYSKTCLAALDFTAVTQRDTESMQHNIAASLRTLLDEDETHGKQQLTPELLARRALSGFAQLALIALLWLALLAIKVYEDSIVEAFETAFGPLAVFAPSFAITFLTMTMTPVLVYLTNFEQWENPAFKLILTALRIYAVKIVVVIILMVQFFEDLTGDSVVSVVGKLFGMSSASAVGSDATVCPQDAIASSLLTLVFTTVIGSVAGSLGKVHGAGALARVLPEPWATKAGRHRESEFDTARKVIDLLYFQAVVWICMPFSAFAVPLSCLCLGFLFKFEVYMLAAHGKRPTRMWGARDVTSWFLTLYLATLGISAVGMAAVWRYHDAARCGPFRGESMAEWIEGQLKSDAALGMLLSVVLHPAMLLLAVLVVWVRGAQKGFEIDALQEHVYVQYDRQRFEVGSYLKQVAGLRAELERQRLLHGEHGPD
eukprot:TRINITY_DN44732_c0_g1_i1.p1 TRINITY_DN44732_c0_g1~~TRINITY_DN44732_c0_g1_i1.p1  ORF type:complete len:921 (+),score=296.25 TRINITY_DN44732_c0_g1_i1:23-2764(+)